MAHRDKYASKVVGRTDRGHRRIDGTLKRPYDQAKAEEVAKLMNSRQEKRVHAYPCSSCVFWHIGQDRSDHRW